MSNFRKFLGPISLALGVAGAIITSKNNERIIQEEVEKQVNEKLENEEEKILKRTGRYPWGEKGTEEE